MLCAEDELEPSPSPAPGLVCAQEARTRLGQCLSRIDRVILGKHEVARLMLAGVISGGHILLEDAPGVGKTTLAHAVAAVLGLKFTRIQFTSDLLPGDITGSMVYDRAESMFRFQPGPVFTHLLLGDEVNRASARTQSALLEAMEEGCVTVDGTRHRLPDPFVVMATQNPSSHRGTSDLPESQLDRFAIGLSMGYPDMASEVRLLTGGAVRAMVDALEPLFDPMGLRQARDHVQSVYLGEAAATYMVQIAHRTREQYRLGLSPRAVLSWGRVSRAAAFLDGRDFVTADDVRFTFPAAAAHRLRDNLGNEVTSLARLQNDLAKWVSAIPCEG